MRDILNLNKLVSVNKLNRQFIFILDPIQFYAWWSVEGLHFTKQRTALQIFFPSVLSFYPIQIKMWKAYAVHLTETIKEEWNTCTVSLSVDCQSMMIGLTENSGLNQHKQWVKQRILSKSNKVVQNPLLREQNKCIAVNIPSTKKRKKHQNMIEQDLFWNYINWCGGCLQLLMVCIFHNLFFTKLALKTAWLYDSLPIQHLETVIQGHPKWRILWGLG